MMHVQLDSYKTHEFNFEHFRKNMRMRGGVAMVLPICCINTFYEKTIKTHFLNKNFDLKHPLFKTCPDIESLYTQGDFEFLSEISICFRSKPISFVNTRHVWEIIMSFGTNVPDWSKLEKGFFFGFWKTGPWIGFKFKEGLGQNNSGGGGLAEPNEHDSGYLNTGMSLPN